MRIVAGAYRGRPLVAPKGHSTRPTADRARQALFNVLDHAHWVPSLSGARIADLFAGSGALGLEALSRGATSCLFVDRDAGARQAITDNIASLGLIDRCEIVAADAARLPKRSDSPMIDIAFLDPPYAEGLASPAMVALLTVGWLAADAIAVVEVGAREPAPEAAGYLALDERVWGAAKVVFYRRA